MSEVWRSGQRLGAGGKRHEHTRVRMGSGCGGEWSVMVVAGTGAGWKGV